MSHTEIVVAILALSLLTSIGTAKENATQPGFVYVLQDHGLSENSGTENVQFGYWQNPHPPLEKAGTVG